MRGPTGKTKRPQSDRKRTRRRRFGERVRRRLRSYLSRPTLWLATLLIPRLYLLYMSFVWATSRIERHDYLRLKSILDEHDGAVGLLWHEEVMSVAYGYHYLGFRPHTLASLSNAGQVITRILELCGFVVFRGGSSSRPSRRRGDVTQEMIEHMRTHRKVIYGLTVDGSQGPPYRMKRGGIIIAREGGKPIALSRTWYKRAIRLRTWDRTAIPLPFNVIGYYLKAPYFVPEDAHTEEGLERFRLKLEDGLIELAAQSYDEMGQPRPENLRKRRAKDSRPERLPPPGRLQPAAERERGGGIQR